MRLLHVVCAGALGGISFLTASASTPDADQLTTALVAMGEARVGEEVLAAWLGQQGVLPHLSGEQLARLKIAGLSDGVLLRLVRGVEAPVAEQSPPLSPPQPLARAGSSARLRVLAQSDSSVDYCELALDGEVVASLGQLFEGVVAAGGRAPRPRSLPLRRPSVLFEGDVAPGRHQVRTGFLASRVQEEFGDLRQGRLQRIVAEGVRALEAGSEDGGTACSVSPGEVCLVTARFQKVGREGYTVRYDTVVLSEEDADVQAANWASPEP